MIGTKRSRNMANELPRRAKYNAYKEALLNPISGPLVGIPTSVPVDSHRARLKATTTITVTGGSMNLLANPVFGLCSDLLPSTPGGVGVSIGAFNWINATSFPTTGTIGGTAAVTTNAQYTRAQFAGLTNLSSVRGRVVSCCLRICNVSAANTRNGVFTLFTDQQHNTLQAKTPSDVATDPKAQQYNASVPDWHTMTYHPVEPDEADSWVWDPTRGPQGGVKTGAYVNPDTSDRSAADNFPGYMGIWWQGDAVSQTFQVEMYIVAEYVGALVQPLVRDNGVDIEDAQEAREAAEQEPIHIATAQDGSAHSGHPASESHPSRAQRMLDFGKEHAGALKNIAKAGGIGLGGLIGGPQGAMAAAEYLLSADDLKALGRFDSAQKKIRSKSSPATPSRRPALGYERGRSTTPRTTYRTPQSARRR